MTKRTILVALIGLNMLLGAALLLSAYQPPSAFAQAGGRAGDFTCVTGRAPGQAYDVLYVLDLPERKLHAFYPSNPQTKQLKWANFVDLTKEFRER